MSGCQTPLSLQCQLAPPPQSMSLKSHLRPISMQGAPSVGFASGHDSPGTDGGLVVSKVVSPRQPGPASAAAVLANVTTKDVFRDFFFIRRRGSNACTRP